MSQMRIFLSHSSADNDFADALAKALRDAGADVWYDGSHLGIGRLLRDISKQVASRPIFLVTLSKAAFSSDWVKEECEWAWNLLKRDSNRKIVPIVVQPIDRSDWNEMLWLEGFHRVEGPNSAPRPRTEAIEYTLHLLGLASSGEMRTARPSADNTSSRFARRNVDKGHQISPQRRQRPSREAPVLVRPPKLPEPDTETPKPNGLVCPACGARNFPGIYTCQNCGILMQPSITTS